HVGGVDNSHFLSRDNHRAVVASLDTTLNGDHQIFDYHSGDWLIHPTEEHDINRCREVLDFRSGIRVTGGLCNTTFQCCDETGDRDKRSIGWPIIIQDLADSVVSVLV